jgi:hypothetical protein
MGMLPAPDLTEEVFELPPPPQLAQDGVEMPDLPPPLGQCDRDNSCSPWVALAV